MGVNQVSTLRGPKDWRGDESGAGITSLGFARYYESVVRGNCFGVANQAGVTSQAGLSVTTPVLTLYNPAGSGYNGVLLYAGSVATIAVAASMTIWLGVNTNIAAAAVTGTATTAHRNLLLGNGAQPHLQPLLAATLPATPVAIATLGLVPGTLAVNSQNPFYVIGREFAGSVILAPGSALSLQTSTASGAAGLWGEFMWAEVLTP